MADTKSAKERADRRKAKATKEAAASKRNALMSRLPGPGVKPANYTADQRKAQQQYLKGRK